MGAWYPKSKVYFMSVGEFDGFEIVKQKLARLIDKSRLFDFIRERSRVAVKLHFGEEGNTGHVRPEYVSVICDSILKASATPFLTDTNALYRGMRTKSEDHLKIAAEHGFTRDVTRCDVIIPDDTKKENVAEVPVDGDFIKTAKIARIFLDADGLVGVAHFKGHLLTGFGGALKNIGMGCAVREGKLAQHSEISPIINLKRCVECMECAKACPADAIFLKGHRVFIDGSKCIGCASCIAACNQGAIEVDWEAGGSNVQEKMAEYAKAVLKDRKDAAAFINFAIRITKECDCLAKDDPRIVSDIGILASTDPVAVDKASLDLVIDACGRDIFKEAHPRRDGMKQLRHASGIGLGSLDYELVRL
jgi:uncharacterized Fe-S center protein